jgi:hypothetical protein
MEAFRGEVPSLERSGTERLHQDVGTLHEAEQEVLALRLGQIEGHRAFVAGDELPPQRHPAHLPPQVPGDVTGLGMLDLDDVGAEVPQPRGHAGPGDHRGHVQHPDPLER